MRFVICDNCGRDFEGGAGMWECPHCGMDNTKGRVRGKLFQMYCTERSRGTSKEEARRIAIEVVARLDVETT